MTFHTGLTKGDKFVVGLNVGFAFLNLGIFAFTGRADNLWAALFGLGFSVVLALILRWINKRFGFR